MKVDVKIAGASYNEVPSVLLPLTAGGKARFCEVSDTTAEMLQKEKNSIRRTENWQKEPCRQRRFQYQKRTSFIIGIQVRLRMSGRFL